MSGFLRKIFVFCAIFTAAANAQNIGIGVRGGLPLTDFLHAESKTAALTNVVTGKGNVIIGPMFELRLPLGLGIEMDALYRHWDVESTQPNTGSSSSWDFPIYGKFHFPIPLIRPYVGAGVNFQHIGDVGKFLGGTPVDSSRRGFLGAAGIEFKLPKARLSPELRYTYWNANGAIHSSNQVDFLIGLSF